jgi:hypothetical protein
VSLGDSKHAAETQKVSLAYPQKETAQAGGTSMCIRR